VVTRQTNDVLGTHVLARTTWLKREFIPRPHFKGQVAQWKRTKSPKQVSSRGACLQQHSVSGHPRRQFFCFVMATRSHAREAQSGESSSDRATRTCTQSVESSNIIDPIAQWQRVSKQQPSFCAFA